ncbi:MAG TPA: serine hydrolase [Candidatus Baltobacteraceae bacterium]|nr:serine hydrolase [Candidatus Baltobacteraceae bacterium]
MRWISLVAALLWCCAAPALAQQDDALTSQLQSLAGAYHGKVALYAIDLRSGKTVALNADTPVPTASVIKLTILYDALKQIQAGTASFGDELVLTKDNQVGGSGVLGLFDTPLHVTLKDALTMMVVVSDNTATNLAIDRLGLQNIDAQIAALGLKNTYLYKKVFKPAPPGSPADQPQFGLGKTTAREMAQVMAHFATCDTFPKALCDAAVDMLKNQTDRDAIPRYLSGVEIANKTGAVNEARNDVAIVYAKNGPIIISAFTYDNKDQRWSPDNAALLLMGRMAQSIVGRWQ